MSISVEDLKRVMANKTDSPRWRRLEVHPIPSDTYFRKPSPLTGIKLLRICKSN